jgi:hypothetical protein
MRHTTWERLYTATLGLATGSSDIQERIYYAVNIISPLQTWEFPEEFQDDIEYVRSEMSKFNSLQSLRNGLSEEKASELAEKIFEIFHNILYKYCEPEED